MDLKIKHLADSLHALADGFAACGSQGQKNPMTAEDMARFAVALNALADEFEALPAFALPDTPSDGASRLENIRALANAKPFDDAEAVRAIGCITRACKDVMVVFYTSHHLQLTRRHIVKVLNGHN